MGTLREALCEAERLLKNDRGETGKTLTSLGGYLLSRKRHQSTNDWAATVAECRAHPLRGLVHQDPLTARTYAKPRGYQGDADLLDIIYARDYKGIWQEQVTPLGQAIFDHTICCKAPSAVRSRKEYIANQIDQTCPDHPDAHVLSVACGHLREAHSSMAIASRRFGRFLGLDQDRRSLDTVNRSFGHLGMEALQGSVRTLLAGQFASDRFDFIYVTGLYDYLHERLAKALTRRLFGMLRHEGRLLIANYLPCIDDVGYMEAYMDWTLVAHSDFPAIGFATAVWLMWGRLITWVELTLCLFLYVISALGVAVGFHRMFTHRSFTCPGAVRCLFGICGSLAAQGPLIYWAAIHRKHHRHSDRVGDPHSPHLGEPGPLCSLRGLWHAHVGWMWTRRLGGYYRLVPDLLGDPVAVFVTKYYLVWVLIGLLTPGLIAGAVRGSWFALFTGALWGGLARIFLLHHVTWSINSICHLFGSAPYETGDQSRNNPVCALLAFGEGWHNNHHAFPTSARHGLRWWQIDGGYAFLMLLHFCGLATDIKVPSRELQCRKLRSDEKSRDKSLEGD